MEISELKLWAELYDKLTEEEKGEIDKIIKGKLVEQTEAEEGGK